MHSLGELYSAGDSIKFIFCSSAKCITKCSGEWVY